MTNSWKPEILATGETKWATNSLRFATKEEAEASAKETFNRWFAATDYRASESDDPITHRWVDHQAVRVEASE